MTAKKKLPEWLRVANALRQHRRGITRLDFQAPHVIDGGKPIVNIPGRIFDLRGKGFVITNEKDPTGVDRYVLVGLPDNLGDTRPPRTVAAAPAAALAGVDDTDPVVPRSAAETPSRPQSAIFDVDWDEVA